ncbi:MAG TPA: protein kinase [Candidatus Angelobacter sp.]|jgi:serine/threonine protein kinase
MNNQIEAINLRPYGSGGRADVKLGNLRHDGSLVIVKVLRDAHLPHMRQAFLREINIMSMQLPGMVRFIAANKTAAQPYYMMEYLPGGTLQKYAGLLSETQLHAVGIWMAETLAGFHLKAGAHGDLKPLNILITRDGHLKLGDPLGNGPIGFDFGLSVLFSPDKGGTEGYRAPEVIRGATPSPLSDSYSFAATLNHLVTGRAPVDGQQLDPTGYGLTCPEWLRQLIVLCSQPDPDTRPTMNDILRALKGESWANIYAEKQKDKALTGLVILGLAGLGLAALFSKTASA